MKNLLALMLLMSLMTVSCNGGGGSDGGSSEESTTQTDNTTTEPVVPVEPTPEPIPEPDPEPTPEPTPDPVVVTPIPTPTSTLPALALSFSTAGVELFDFDSAQTAKYNQAVALVKKVVATEAFRTQVLNHTYNGVKTFANNNGLTNAQIYQSVLDAAERLQPAKNNQMDVGVKLYYENNNVVGYTSSSITYINVNTKYFNTYSASSVAGNLFHEWLHKLGYGHDASATTQRPYSVPYGVGYIIRNVAQNFL